MTCFCRGGDLLVLSYFVIGREVIRYRYRGLLVKGGRKEVIGGGQ